VVEPLVRGQIFTAKQKARQLLLKITGSASGAVLGQHDYLRQHHDLVRYLAFMQSSLSKLRAIEGHQNYVCLDDEDFMEHVVAHVDPFSQVHREYTER
jgi:hypothetical protein